MTSPPEGLVVRPLELTDDRSAFRSGNIDLDRFFQKYAGQYQFRHHIGTTWVAIQGNRVFGFATVSAGHLEVGELPGNLRKRLPTYPVPILRLARLAVAEDSQGLGIGRMLLRAVFTLAWRMAGDFGCSGVVVDAKPEAVGFYKGLGFRPLAHSRGALGDRPEPAVMFLELKAIPKPDNPRGHR